MQTEASEILSGNSYQISQWDGGFDSWKSNPSQVFSSLADWYLKISLPNVLASHPQLCFFSSCQKLML